MVHKVQITNIEHIDWAKRLIITYYLAQDCFNPTLGGWEYIPNACGYLNICNTDWIVIVPNTQHPLHSSSIKTAGTYYFVWDYGGVEGLNPTDFDSDHSYVIQIALADFSCGYLDPCAFSSYQTANGEEPVGLADTAGDSNNTYNNCGVGYHLRRDASGCLYCQKDPIESTGGVDDPPDYFPEPSSNWVFSFSKIVHNVTVVKYPDPDTIGEPGHPDPDPPSDEPDGPSTTGGQDLPEIPVVTPGPKPPTSDLESMNIVSTPGFGDFAAQSMPDRYTYFGGTNNTDTGQFPPGSDIEGSLNGTNIGGRAPSIEPTENMNAKVAPIAQEMVSANDAELNKRRNADQLNISTHNFTVINSDDTINSTSAPVTIRGNTRVIDSISVTDGEVYLRDKSNQRSRINIGNQILDVSKSPVENTRGIPFKNEPESIAQRNSKLAALQIVPDGSSKLAGSPGDRAFDRIIHSDFKTIELARDTQDFASTFDFSFFTEDTVRSGNSIFCEAIIKPKTKKSYNYTVKLYLKNRSGVRQIGSSESVERTGNIVMASKFPCNLAAGSAQLIVVALDQNNEVQGIRVKNITVTESGTKRGGVVGLPSSVPSQASNSIRSLVSPIDSISFPIGGPNYYQEVAFSIIDGSNPRADISMYLESADPNQSHAIELYQNGLFVSRIIGKPLIDGISPLGNYSSALFSVVKRSDWVGTAIVRVSSVDSSPSKVTLNLGFDLRIIKTEVLSRSYDVNTKTLTLSVQTPFPGTSLSVYDAGSPNRVPNSPVIQTTSTNLGGILNVSFTCEPKSWYAIALTNPSNVSLAERTFFYGREDANV
jgi:hypothetical protein